MRNLLFALMCLVFPLTAIGQGWDTDYAPLSQSIRQLSFPDRIFNVTRYGASPQASAAKNQQAINKAIDQIRKQRWRTVPLEIWVRDNIPEPTEDEMEAIPKEKLREWIAELTDMRRAVFNMYCIDGYSHQEIAKMLGITETGSTSILAKARKQLKDKIKRYLKEQDR